MKSLIRNIDNVPIADYTGLKESTGLPFSDIDGTHVHTDPDYTVYLEEKRDARLKKDCFQLRQQKKIVDRHKDPAILFLTTSTDYETKDGRLVYDPETAVVVDFYTNEQDFETYLEGLPELQHIELKGLKLTTLLSFWKAYIGD